VIKTSNIIMVITRSQGGFWGRGGLIRNDPSVSVEIVTLAIILE